MASVTHAKVSAKADGADPTLVLPSDWNAGHVITGLNGVLGLIVDGGGAAITTGVKGYVQAPDAGTFSSWTLVAGGVGSVVVDVWKGTLADHIANTIDSSDTITASARPTLSSARGSTSSTLTGWTTSFSAGDVFWFNVVSATTVSWLNLELKYAKG